MRFIAAAMLVVGLLGEALAAPPIEAYGELPEISAVAISPDGAHYAYIKREGGVEYFVVAAVGGDIIGAARGDFKARGVSFADENHAIFHGSDTTRHIYFRGKWENSGAVSFNLKTKKMEALPQAEELYPAQEGLGRILGRRKGTNDVFMPAWMGVPGREPTYDLLAVDLDSGSGRRHVKGAAQTMDWFVDEDGTVIAREDFREKDRVYRILTRFGGDLQEIYREEDVSIPSISVLGVAADRKGLIVDAGDKEEAFDTVARLSFGGAMSPPLYADAERDVAALVSDLNRNVIGVRMSGLTPSYELEDPALDRNVAAIDALFPDASVYLTGWTDAFAKLLVRVEGGGRTPSYYLFDSGKRTISKIANAYARIRDGDVGRVTTIEYTARDGLKIPALLTLPPRVALGAALPMIVMPHGGPEHYDSVGFNFMAQYFASRGYMVFQPNFRGSAGFGRAHLAAGYGEWGGKMQDDVTDGVELLVRKKWADPARICIVGGSYGGYAALAGGAFAPHLYKCVAAIAPVADLNSMLLTERREAGKNSITYAYWTKLIGDRAKDKAKIEAISPANSATTFKAPVLLVHGEDDTVVPIQQSAKMEAALKKAKKSVRFVRLKGEDHWLSQSETRLQALKEVAAFVDTNIGAGAVTTP